LNVYIIINL